METTDRLIKLLKTLPIELVNKIIQYTYSPQPPLLMYDIRHYVDTRPKFRVKSGQDFLFYIIYFMNNYAPIQYVNIIYALFQRQYNIKTKAQVYRYIYVLIHRLTLESQINIIWGIMTPEERITYF